MRDQDSFRGGPAYYMQRGLKARWLGVLVRDHPHHLLPLRVQLAAGQHDLGDRHLQHRRRPRAGCRGRSASGSPSLTGLVVFGGVRRIASVTQAARADHGAAYLLLGLVVVGAARRPDRPGVRRDLHRRRGDSTRSSAPTFGYIVLTGVKRGMFSNEAGLGSAPNAGASAAVTHPVKQGLVQTLGVYFDTFLVCSITAFIILVSVPDLAAPTRGIGLTQDAIVSTPRRVVEHRC